jgi:hypothetical protein
MIFQFMPTWRKRLLIRKISDETLAAGKRMLAVIDAEKNPHLRFCLCVASAVATKESISRMNSIGAMPMLRIEFRDRVLEYWKKAGFKTHKFTRITINGLKPADLIPTEKIIELIGGIDAKSDH